MIHSLRRKMILFSAISIALVISVVYLAIFLFETLQLNSIMDTLTDAISENGGSFPPFDRDHPDRGPLQIGIITPETRFSTRFFSVWLDESSNIIQENVELIFSITSDEVVEYSKTVIKRGNERI